MRRVKLPRVNKGIGRDQIKEAGVYHLLGKRKNKSLDKLL